MTIGEAEIMISRDIKAIYGRDEAQAIARLVLGHVCNISKTQLIIKRQDPLYKMEERSIRQIRDELATGKPVQYILGETTFYGLRLKVTPAVLIPRPETEELVEWILKECGGRASGGKDEGLRSKDERLRNKDEGEETKERILDIGTGSGCIPIALKKNLPGAEICGLDISPEALQVAKENAVLNDAEVHFMRGDILKHSIRNPQLLCPSPYTIIVSNPPYITQSEKEQMHQNVLDHEPHTALFVPDNDPLLFYKTIAQFSLSHLAENGLLFLEINEFLGDDTVSLLQSQGFRNCVLRKDLQGKARMIKAEI